MDNASAIVWECVAVAATVRLSSLYAAGDFGFLHIATATLTPALYTDK